MSKDDDKIEGLKEQLIDEGWKPPPGYDDKEYPVKIRLPDARGTVITFLSPEDEAELEAARASLGFVHRHPGVAFILAFLLMVFLLAVFDNN